MADEQKYELMSLDELESRSLHLQNTIAGLRKEQRELTPILDVRREEAEIARKLGKEVRLVPVTDDPEMQRRFAAAAGVNLKMTEGG